MKPSEYYKYLLDSLSDETERRIFRILVDHIGTPIKRVELISLVFGKTVAEEELANNGRDRAIRKYIEALRSKSFPIVSTSSEAGYELCADPDRVDKYIAEENSRIARINEKIGFLQRSKKVAGELRDWRAGADMPVQERMF